MSHKATNWAVTVRGIPAAAKVVLWHLADRHNKDTGRCDPSQDLLAEDCEISRSSLNNQLKLLEDAGLITRIQRVNSATKRHQSTAYILHFDVVSPQDVETRVQNLDTEAVSKNEGEPCPKNGQSRVQNLDTNPVKNQEGTLRARAFSSSEDFWAETIRLAKPWAVSQVSAMQARELIAQGKVTEDECRKAGVL